jgi:hypothetical protein
LVCAIGLAAGLVSVSWPQLATVRQEHNNVPAGELVAGRQFGQTFGAAFSGLYRVDVMLATYARTNEGPVLFHMSDGVGGAELITITIDASRLCDNAYQRFFFDPIERSANREFLFYLEAPGSETGNAITVWKTSFDSYPGGQAYVDGHPAEGDVRFAAYYRSNPSEVWDSLSSRVRSWHPLLWQMRWVVLAAAALWLLGIGVLLGELLIAVARSS